VRDENNPSHAGSPLYKGISSDYVRDEGFFAINAKLRMDNGELRSIVYTPKLLNS
jgi:hypothetical protein